jgi:hypothetical protein
MDDVPLAVVSERKIVGRRGAVAVARSAAGHAGCPLVDRVFDVTRHDRGPPPPY